MKIEMEKLGIIIFFSSILFANVIFFSSDYQGIELRIGRVLLVLVDVIVLLGLSVAMMMGDGYVEIPLPFSGYSERKELKSKITETLMKMQNAEGKELDDLIFEKEKYELLLKL